MSDKPRCMHVSRMGRRCVRDAGHENTPGKEQHWLEAEPSVDPNFGNLSINEETPPTEKKFPRPETPREQALEYLEPETGRLASAIVYAVDTFREIALEKGWLKNRV